jgi:sortase A
VARVFGTASIVAGIGAIAWALVVWQWQDPFTALYTHWQQGKLASQYKREVAHYRLPARVAPRESAAETSLERIAAAAKQLRSDLGEGKPVGRLIVPRLDLNAIVVNGTAHDDLAKGPGRELHTFMPGQDELVYVAGHRTTYSAPFSDIDKLRRGDRITFELPYATFVYEITGHRVVPADDIAVLRSKHHEELILQACHPRFFATHRYLAFARPVRIVPRSGAPVLLS